ncbi:pumilio homolog 3-like isoform X2 [Pollicipes pollicipes]|uniref:pumilio homolog 3-like isoform X2 n=1 Tax=Pollicipes pollicipes TaxID=41117 RepID=UPI001884CC46|nr:pumilio homolog 3-like isoform X2 [Pollicipes pollicipes]
MTINGSARQMKMKKKKDSVHADNGTKQEQVKKRKGHVHAKTSEIPGNVTVEKVKNTKAIDTKWPKKRKRNEDSSEQQRPAKIQHQDGAPNWRQVRADAAEIKDRRKAHNKMYEVGKHMKKLWEEVRVDKCPEERRRQLLPELVNMVRGRVPQMVRAHDRARVCETLFELGGPETRAVLFDEVRQQLVELSRDKYARHFVLKILSYGSAEQKQAVGEGFRGRVPALMGHKFASEVGEAYFRDCAPPEAQQRMLMEFYGTEFLIMGSEPRDMAQLIAEHPEKRVIYLTNTRSQLQALLDKQLLTGTLAHRLLREYLSLCAEADRADVVESLREAVVTMLHTKDGARVGLMCLWWGTAKDRKAIVKSLKTYAQKACTDEHGFLVMLALFDVVDDTRLVRKALLDEMMTNIVDIVASEHGRKVVHYLLSPRSTVYFHPQLIATLAEGDQNSTSKKDPEVRRRELLEGVSEPLLKTASIHCLEWMADSNMCILMTHILTKCTADSLKLPLMQLARRLAEPVTSTADGHLVNNSAAYMQLKKLIQADRQRSVANASVLFSTLILQELSADALISWLASNRTAFLLVIMLETEVPAVVEKVLEVMLPHSKKLKPACKGAEILKKKLSAASKQMKTTYCGD